MKRTTLLICAALVYFVLNLWNDGVEQPIQDKPAVVDVSGNMAVHFVDVGQGDCQLVASNGEFMLVDCGEAVYSQSVIDYLKSCGVNSLEYVIATHPHSDHMGGMYRIISEFDVENVIMPDATNNTGAFEKMLMAIEKKQLEITMPVVGDVYNLGESRFEIIAPYRDYGDLNNASVGIKLTFGNTSFVMCGDAEKESEMDICQRDISCNVLKLNHHGSSTSSSQQFFDSTDPDIVVISCGKDNDYGHPHREVVAELAKRGLEALRTDELGTIVFESDGAEIQWYSLGSEE